MKKLLLVLALATISNATFSQDQTKSDSAFQSNLDNAMDEYVEWYKTTNSFKVGGDDMHVVGLLEGIFFNEGIKHAYGQINPDITRLAINGHHPEDLLKTCTYDKWINSIPLLDSNQYHVRYYYREVIMTNGKMTGTEKITITDKNTSEERSIVIHYYEYSLRSIIDSERSLYN